VHSHLMHLALAVSSSHWHSLVCGKGAIDHTPLTTAHTPSADPLLLPP